MRALTDQDGSAGGTLAPIRTSTCRDCEPPLWFQRRIVVRQSGPKPASDASASRGPGSSSGPKR
jgi:hypothetical protein